jgi:hypothetical protein
MKTPRRKRNRKREGEKSLPAAEPQAYLRDINGTLVLFRKSAGYAGERAILYSGKLDKSCSKPLAVAKYLFEEIRINPSAGWRLLEQECKFPAGNEKGYLPKMMQKVGEYLEAQQPVFAEMDRKIVDIVNQHRDYTIKEIAAELDKQFPGRKFDTLEKRVRRLLKNVPWHVSK